MKIAIIGAGASGLFLANMLYGKYDFTIFNNGKIGRKILASGNGRCNIANNNLDVSKYHNNQLVNKLLVNKDKVFDEFKRLKIYLKEDSEGRLYPISESSLSILNILSKNVIDNIVDIKVTKIDKKNGKYIINNMYSGYDKVIVGVGSISSVVDKDIYKFLDGINVKFNDFKPSLVGFKVKNKIKAISGVRSKCNVSLFNGNKLVHSEDGEVIFKDDGISGICVMNLSSYYAHLNNINKPYIKIDLLNGNKYDNLESVINPKLLEYISKNNINPNDFRLDIIDTYGFENSQVSKGGIDINSLNDDLSIKSDPNMYFMGEVIDVDGICGGYNLFFAFLSAVTVFEGLK
ncbi:MAG: NAD(P)/FAD-dependent oxidoreductase [Acholeplasmatales bacterium]|nr:NAD(P)/FAD-dependent oxidoreductase [Acholeplasmatales bacterium]